MPTITFEYDSVNYDPAAPMVIVALKGSRDLHSGTEILALLDSGADASMLPINILRTVGARYLRTRQMRGVIGQSVVVDTYLVIVQVGDQVLGTIEAVAMSEGTDAVIGRDVLNQLIITLNGLAAVTEIDT